MSETKTFKATYQDRALNKRTLEFTAASWSDALPAAYSYGYRRADEKLIALEVKVDPSERTCGKCARLISRLMGNPQANEDIVYYTCAKYPGFSPSPDDRACSEFKKV